MAGEISIRVNRSVSVGGVTVGGLDETVSGADTQHLYVQDITTGTTNAEVDFPITVANSKVQAIMSTKAVTVKTNSTSAPTQTIALTANVPRIWTASDPSGGKVFTADVTVLYITNASGATATVKVAVASDQTP